MRFGREHLKSGVTSHGAQSIGIHSPAVNRESMFRSARWHDDAAKASRFQRPGNLPRSFPEKLRMLESLAGHDHIRAFRLDLAPIIRIAQDHVDIGARGEIDTDVFPRGRAKSAGSSR